MKTKLLLIAFFIGITGAFAQKYSEIEIMTSAQCGMCKERIEKALAYEKGVASATVDMETKKVKVKYHGKKTNPDKLRLAISKLGHDADDIAADPVAYEKLPACCKKPTDPNKSHQHGSGCNH